MHTIIYKNIQLRVLLVAILNFIVLSGFYVLVKPVLKTLLFDTIGINQSYISIYEPIIFWSYVLTLTIVFTWLIILIESKKLVPNFRITNQITENTYQPEDYRKVNNYYKAFIKKEQTQFAKQFYDISKYYPKSVYALTGGWRAGKTTSVGMLINIIKNDKDNNIVSETYHDCFNFGNIDESISAFFQALAIKTGTSDFYKLSKVSTPSLDMGFKIGPFSFSYALSRPIWANEIRSLIFKKLHENVGQHIVVIDDIDRLLPSEQYQWLKVIELLGKFHNKLVILLPVHIEEVANNLQETYNLNSRYIDKIIPKKNRLPVGVDVSYIKSLMSVSGRSQLRVKRVYTKYLISLALRQSISNQVARKIVRKSEWYNEVYRGGISEIANIFSEKIPRRDSQTSELIVNDLVIGHDESIWFKQSKSNYDNNSLNSLLFSKFLYSHKDNDMTDEIGDTNFQRLRTVSFLYSLFGEQSYQYCSGANNYNVPKDIDDSLWKDYWIDILWPVAKLIKSDKNLSQLFTYQDIDREVVKLMKASSEDDERHILASFVLEWKV